RRGDGMRGEGRMNTKCQTRPGFDTFSAKSADLTGLKMRRITRAGSFDHLVGERQQLRRNFEAKRLSSFAVKDEFEFVYLLDGQVSGLDALKNATHVNAPFVITIPEHRSVAH